MKRRSVCVVTGTRAEYGLMKPVLRAIDLHPRLALRLMVTGMHLAPEFGRTIDEIRKDGFRISYKVAMHPKGDGGAAMARAVGEGIVRMTSALSGRRPDLMLLVGDRTEALSAAVAGAYLNIPIAHIHGGDVSAGLDESARHAITKLSHIHFPATAKSRQRVLRLGEDPRNVHLVGSPTVDSILAERTLTKKELAKRLGVDFKRPLAVLIQHAVTTQVGAAAGQIRETLTALESLDLQTVAIYPNSDAGGRAIIREYEKRQAPPWLKLFKSLPHDTYLSLLRHADVLVGNSSSGAIESSSFRIPVVNVGIRQKGRERGANVIDAPHDRRSIAAAVRRALSDARFRSRVERAVNPYGDGRASARIATLLAKAKLDSSLLHKRLHYK